MLHDISQNLLSVADAKAWLSHVIAEELGRIRHGRVVFGADPVGPAEDDRRADWATAQAWKLMAQGGPKAEVTNDVAARLRTEGATEADLYALETHLSMNTQDVMSEARMNRIARGFMELTDLSTRPGNVELLHLRKLLIEGRAAAWAQADSAGLNPEPEIARTLAEHMTEALLSSQKAAYFAQPAAATDQSTPVASAQAQPVAHVDPAPSAVPDVVPSAYDPCIFAVTRRLNAAKTALQSQGSAEGAALSAMEKMRLATATLFVKATDIQDVRHIHKADVARFRDALLKLPKSWGKSRKDEGAPIADIFERARCLPADKVGLSVTTINRHLDMLRQILDRADGEGIEIDPKVQPKKLRLRETVRRRNKRPAFSAEDLALLFQHHIWTGCHSPRFRNKPGKSLLKDGLYWVPLIAAYTGARREEIAALSLGDIREENGISFFNFAENDNRGVKTLAGERRVPVHDRLIALGLLDHVAALRRKKSSDLFPELKPKGHVKGSLKKYGETLYYNWENALNLVFGDDKHGYGMHSFRHYMNDTLARETSVPKIVRLELIGHEGEDTNESVYTKGAAISELHKAINHLPVVESLVERSYAPSPSH